MKGTQEMKNEQNKIPIIAIVGPTASGKTALSIEMAKGFLGEIISVDSMQIYKEFKICTAKPNESQLKTIKHYLIDEVSVEESFSVADYIKKARIYAEKIWRNGKTPIVVGGTGLYLDAFLGDFALETKQADSDIRKKLLERADTDKGELFQELVKVDPISAQKIHPNDVKRTVRALEFYYSFGYSVYEQTKKTQEKSSHYRTTFIGLNFKDRKILHDRIENRVDEMFGQGLIEEVESISKRKHIGKTASAAIGYKEIIPYLKGEIPLAEAERIIKKETKAYAKRQITWFKKNKSIHWIYVDEYNSFSNVVSEAFKIAKEGGFLST